ncbi:hypothetical protein ACIRPK_26145 [Kitasatospora sp. NPDC101801]|uniref:hypothetical protein n=1 Tax=Kitasatospora sp. NPDC101801 TaxID=3364103 RepID=UPI003823E8DE
MALAPLAGRAGYGVVHDHKVHSRELVLCPGSMTQLPLSEAQVFQDQLDLEAALAGQHAADQPPLFT